MGDVHRDRRGPFTGCPSLRCFCSAHRYKYRLALADQRECVLRYDNESGKGDHRQIGWQEQAYQFSSIEKLLEDFDADTRAYLDEHPGD